MSRKSCYKWKHSQTLVCTKRRRGEFALFLKMMHIGRNNSHLYSVYSIDTVPDLLPDVFRFVFLGLNVLIICFTLLQIQCSDWSRRNWKTPLTCTITAWKSKCICRSQVHLKGHVNGTHLQSSFADKNVVYETDRNCFSLFKLLHTESICSSRCPYTWRLF